ncbi:MAG TPA: DUF445 family protein [Chitinophagaceae bacterium]
MNYWYFIIPFLTAFIGWLIHSAAILFFLRNILPKKKNAIAQSLARKAAAEFASFRGLEEKINDPSNLDNIMPEIEAHIDHFLNEKLKKEMPVISMFIGNKTTDKLKEVFMKELKTLFPQIISRFAANLKSGINVEEIVLKKINALSPAATEQLIRNNLGAELKYIARLGAFTGFIAGLVGVIVIVLTR